MYKDTDKRKEASKERMRRYRQGVTKGVTSVGCNSEGVTGFDSLTIDVQRSIDSLSRSPEEKAQRTAIALDYQYKHGKRPCTGMDCHIPASTAKPGDDDYHTHTGPDEGCSQCHSTLPRLEQPRQYPGMCMVCVVKGAA